MMAKEKTCHVGGKCRKSQNSFTYSFIILEVLILVSYLIKQDILLVDFLMFLPDLPN